MQAFVGTLNHADSAAHAFTGLSLLPFLAACAVAAAAFTLAGCALIAACHAQGSISPAEAERDRLLLSDAPRSDAPWSQTLQHRLAGLLAAFSTTRTHAQADRPSCTRAARECCTLLCTDLSGLRGVCYYCRRSMFHWWREMPLACCLRCCCYCKAPPPPVACASDVNNATSHGITYAIAAAAAADPYCAEPFAASAAAAASYAAATAVYPGYALTSSADVINTSLLAGEAGRSEAFVTPEASSHGAKAVALDHANAGRGWGHTPLSMQHMLSPSDSPMYAQEQGTPPCDSSAYAQGTPPSDSPMYAQGTPPSASPACTQGMPSGASPACAKRTPSGASPACAKRTTPSASPAGAKRTPPSASVVAASATSAYGAVHANESDVTNAPAKEHADGSSTTPSESTTFCAGSDATEADSSATREVASDRRQRALKEPLFATAVRRPPKCQPGCSSSGMDSSRDGSEATRCCTDAALALGSVPDPPPGWPAHTAYQASEYTADAAAALAANALCATSATVSPFGRPCGDSLLMLGGAGSAADGRQAHAEFTPVAAEPTPAMSLDGDCALAIAVAAEDAPRPHIAPTRFAEVRKMLRSVLAEVRIHPANGERAEGRRFALQAHVESQWSSHWAQVDLPSLLRGTAISARELLASEPALVPQVSAQMRTYFEALDAIYTYYASVYADLPARGLSVARSAAGNGWRAGTPSRTLGEAGWLAFCSDTTLGSHADLSWFAPPNEMAAADPHTRREVCERALYRSILDRRSTTRRPSRGARGGLEVVSLKSGLSFPEFLQAILLTCWRRAAQPLASERRADAAAAPQSSSSSRMAVATKQVVAQAILPIAKRLDILPFRRALASSASLHAAAYALQPALSHLFEHFGEMPTKSAVRRGGSQGSKDAVVGVEAACTMDLSDFGRAISAAGGFDEGNSLGLCPADAAGAFVASLTAPNAASLGYDGFVEAIMRLLADRTEGGSPGSASTPAANAVAAAMVAAPSPNQRIPYSFTRIDEASTLGRLPLLVGRMLMATLPADKGEFELMLAVIEHAAMGRAKTGERDALLDQMSGHHAGQAAEKKEALQQLLSA